MAEVIGVEREGGGYVNKWLKGLNKGLSGWPGKHSSSLRLPETTFFTFVLNADQYGFHLLISIMPYVICQPDIMKLERAEAIWTFSLAWLSPVHQMPVIREPISPPAYWRIPGRFASGHMWKSSLGWQVEGEIQTKHHPFSVAPHLPPPAPELL